MSDYISRSALIDFMIRNVVTLTEEAHDFKVEMIDAIKNQPTIDEKEIIRKAFERVVERLEDAVKVNKEKGCEMQTKELHECALIGFSRMNAFLDAIEIVKEECGISE